MTKTFTVTRPRPKVILLDNDVYNIIDRVTCADTPDNRGLVAWCADVKPLDESLGLAPYEQIINGGKLIFYALDSADKWELTMDKLLRGIGLWLEDPDSDNVEIKDNYLLTSTLTESNADKIIQYALFGKIKFEENYDRLTLGKYTASRHGVCYLGKVYILDQYLDKQYPMYNKQPETLDAYDGYRHSDLYAEFKNIILDPAFDSIRDKIIPNALGEPMGLPFPEEIESLPPERKAAPRENGQPNECGWTAYTTVIISPNGQIIKNTAVTTPRNVRPMFILPVYKHDMTCEPTSPHETNASDTHEKTIIVGTPDIGQTFQMVIPCNDNENAETQIETFLDKLFGKDSETRKKLKWMFP